MFPFKLSLKKKSLYFGAEVDVLNYIKSSLM
jgi:hypothetical protein